MISCIIREYSKLAQKKYKPKHDGVEKLIHKELCKKSKFGSTEMVDAQTWIRPREWDTQNSLGFGDKTDQQIPSISPDLW